MSRVRLVVREDLDRIAEIEQRCFSNPWARDALEAEIARSWARVLVAEDDSVAEGPLVAFANFWLVADEVHVLNVATDPAHRGRGHARALIARLLEMAAAASARTVLLEVRPSNAPAIALYAGFGFETVGRRPRYYDDGEDALLMSKTL